ncbi:MAG: rhodanese-like domain-containing protein [Myxococcota bacterium]
MDSKRIVFAMAVTAVAVALIIALADGAGRQEAGESADWAAQIELEGDHITPRALADRMLAQQGDTVVVDVRPVEEYAAWHLPGAVNMTVPVLLGDDGAALLAEAEGKLVVLTSNGMVHPGQAWAELARRGHANVRVLEGGLTEFKREVLTPPSLRGPISEARAAAERPQYEAAMAFFRGPDSGSRAASTPVRTAMSP